MLPPRLSVVTLFTDDVPALRRFYEPGEPERLRSRVRPVDHGPLWTAYLDALTGAVR